MTDFQLEDHIQSRDWDYVDTKARGTEEFQSHIGILRILFKDIGDPKKITTLLAPGLLEVWALRDSAIWERIHYDAR